MFIRILNRMSNKHIILNNIRYVFSQRHLFDPEKDYYSILDVDTNANQDLIKESYFKLLQYHKNSISNSSQ